VLRTCKVGTAHTIRLSRSITPDRIPLNHVVYEAIRVFNLAQLNNLVLIYYNEHCCHTAKSFEYD
jgi:hypothetical protein